MSNYCRIQTSSHVKSLLFNLPLNSMCVLCPRLFVILFLPYHSQQIPIQLSYSLSFQCTLTPPFSQIISHLLNSIISPETIPLLHRRFLLILIYLLFRVCYKEMCRDFGGVRKHGIDVFPVYFGQHFIRFVGTEMEWLAKQAGPLANKSFIFCTVFFCTAFDVVPLGS